MTPLTEWESDGIHNGWIMPAAPTWKRLPIIRHVRAINEYLFVRRLERVAKYTCHQERWIALGIWLGKERDQ